MKTAEGQVMQSPQFILDQLLGSLSFDPLAFARKSAAEQYQALQQACGVDLQAIDRQNKDDYLARTIANRTAKEKRAVADSISLPEQIPERIDVAELIKERQRRERLNFDRNINYWRSGITWSGSRRRRCHSGKSCTCGRIGGLRVARLTELLAWHRDALPPLPGLEIFSDIDEKIAKSRAVK